MFNRSYYEEVLITRVHPELLKSQRIPSLPKNLDRLWEQRYRAIREHEQHLAASGMVILKFWLNVSKKEQRKRFLARLEEPEKNWKFNAGDVGERAHWKTYMQAYEDALNATSRPWAPWYAIPADSKSYMRLCVAEIVVKTLKNLNLRYPKLDRGQLTRLGEMRKFLQRS